MTRIGLVFLAAALLSAASVRAAATNDAPEFNEVLGLVRAHLAGATDAELNRMAVDALLAALRGKVAIVGGDARAVRTNAPLAKASLLENNVAYLRVARLDEPLAKDCAAALAQLAATNKLIGVVLDLRFAEGDDYAAAAAAVADLFQAKTRPLIDWGQGVVTSKEKTNAIRLPVGVLVNRESGEAAEALAGMLRETGAGLILGGVTAGRAMIGQEFPLKNGQRLRVATLPVKVGDGIALATGGLKPDIEVLVSPDDERLLLEDPYAAVSRLAVGAGGASLTSAPAVTNRVARRPRPNEAALVQARRDGLNLDGEVPEARNLEPARPQLRDPVLARALDLLKGLAVVRATRP